MYLMVNMILIPKYLLLGIKLIKRIQFVLHNKCPVKKRNRCLYYKIFRNNSLFIITNYQF